MRKLEKRARTVFTPEGRKAAGLFGAYLGVLASSAFLSEPFCAPSELSSRSPERIPLRSSELDQDRGIPNMQLILDKLTLPFEQPRLSRPRLLGLLQSSLNSCTSTIINGRAGTGKTLLAADFARRSGRRVAWYKVNASDGDLRVFFPYLIESVRRQGRPGFGEQTLAPLLEAATIEDMPVLAEAFVFELLERGGDPLLIVIDDLHLVYDEEWVVPFFRRLLPLLPAEAHILITGRSLPPAPLWRMRSKQMLCVIEEPVLAFTPQEAVKLFEAYNLSEAHASVAMQHSRGRAGVLDRFASVLSSSGKAVSDSFIATERRLRKTADRQLQNQML